MEDGARQGNIMSGLTACPCPEWVTILAPRIYNQTPCHRPRSFRSHGSDDSSMSCCLLRWLTGRSSSPKEDKLPLELPVGAGRSCQLSMISLEASNQKISINVRPECALSMCNARPDATLDKGK